MFDSLEIIKENSHEDASLRLQELIGKFIQDNEKFSLGLSGGSTPRFFYQNFANTYQENSDISLWTIDDRHVPISDEISNQRMINEIFNKTKMNILELQFNENPNISADEYSKLVLSKIQNFNSAILGVGDDGHIASLFPNTTAMNNKSIGFVANEVNILSKWRITSTFELLSNIENLYLLVTGENKSDILKKIGRDNGLPVNELIKRRKKTTLVTDQKI
jgi:6-phosphogluconolactonase